MYLVLKIDLGWGLFLPYLSEGVKWSESLSVMSDFLWPMDSMEFSRPEYWSG